jgi:leukotriene-A4 hydrolase
LPVDKLSTTQWSPQAVIYFIKALPLDLTDDRLGELDGKLGLSAGENAEIGRTWFTEVARRRHLPAYPAMRDYLGRFGRTRLIQPVYRELAANGEDLQLARKIFSGYRSRYHPLTVAAVEPLLAQPAPD